METYNDIRAQIKALEMKAEQMLKQEKAAGIAEICQRMQELGITIEDLDKASTRATARAKGVVKYRSPNGETWSGGPGRRPAWVKAVLAANEDIEQYRV